MYEVKVKKDAVSLVAEAFAEDGKTVVSNAVAFKLVDSDGYRVSISLAPCYVDLPYKDGKKPDLEDGIQQVKKLIHEAISNLTFKGGDNGIKTSGDTKGNKTENNPVQPVQIHNKNNG